MTSLDSSSSVAPIVKEDGNPLDERITELEALDCLWLEQYYRKKRDCVNSLEEGCVGGPHHSPESWETDH